MAPRSPRTQFREPLLDRRSDSVPLKRRESVAKVEVEQGRRFAPSRPRRLLEAPPHVDEPLGPARQRHPALPVFEEEPLQPSPVVVDKALGDDAPPHFADPDGAGRVSAGLSKEHDAGVEDPTGGRWELTRPPQPAELADGAEQPVHLGAVPGEQRLAEVLRPHP